MRIIPIVLIIVFCIVVTVGRLLNREVIRPCTVVGQPH